MKTKYPSPALVPFFLGMFFLCSLTLVSAQEDSDLGQDTSKQSQEELLSTPENLNILPAGYNLPFPTILSPEYNLPFPTNRLGPAPEGWIKIRYSILSDGNVANVELLNVMPTRMSTTDMLESIEAWKFDPVTEAGEAIDWHNNVRVISFDSEDIPNASNAQFREAYARAQKFLEEGKVNRARSATQRILREHTSSLNDIGLANTQLANIEIKAQNFNAAYLAISDATEPNIDQLVPEELAVALQYRFALELTLGRYIEAYQSYERRITLEGVPALPTDSAMLVQAEAILSALDSDKPIAIKANIEEDFWAYTPSKNRRIFTLADIEGSINDIDVICNRRLLTLPYQKDVDWTLPEDWGNCSLKVNGRDNTTFTLYEFK